MRERRAADDAALFRPTGRPGRGPAFFYANPPGYRLRPELGDDIRSSAYGNYVIFFVALPEEITIIRILHGARDIPAILTPGDSL
ncbi:hypothetical protein TVNIR_2267 [Thioalkalivibrio nitratireducens DSM 14787]|uniref:Plasmid stabilization system n=1 Tax=Thioalkalivibrio nitratireducens (strain DSM 14787 / UNIQEM 213 / ALEN2) TaxID=1255043 RepID=L0DZY2_THIND|nr:type II toxin-antitoxin system RelE/ParE family toxin [Thioalkalivibrio nitratireducens]AGA33921.1 hypothetical protein TVNIR_2267 [Thioalkalivibrio nitratireducens DSM 14787]